MARVIFDEQFNDRNLRARGWSADAPGYYWENDPQLGQVLYARWTNKKRGMPDNGAGTFFKNVSVQEWKNTITIHSVHKFHNWIYNGNKGNSHTMLRASVNGVLGNASGEVMLESFRNGYGTRTYPHNSRDGDRAFAVSFDMGAIGGDRYFANDDMEHYLDDDVWYETALFLDTDNGGSNGRVALWYRKLGDTAWQRIFDYEGYTVLDVPVTKPFVGIGPYFHENFNNDEVRSYIGFITVYEGDAMKDGTLSGGAPKPPITEDPDKPDTPPTGGDEVVISDLKVVPATTVAHITWKTNVPANSVFDYGATEKRGMIIRNKELVTDHAVVLKNLAPGTTYYYRFSSKDANGNIAFDPENKTFTTPAQGVEPPILEPTEHPIEGHTNVNFVSPQRGDVLFFDGTTWTNADLDALVEAKVRAMMANAKVTVVV